MIKSFLNAVVLTFLGVFSVGLVVVIAALIARGVPEPFTWIALTSYGVFICVFLTEVAG